ncbi:hypothetical protein D1872_342000 [compost metagenome]
MENRFVRETISVIINDMKMGKGPLLKRTFFAICGMTGVDAFEFSGSRLIGRCQFAAADAAELLRVERA